MDTSTDLASAPRRALVAGLMALITASTCGSASPTPQPSAGCTPASWSTPPAATEAWADVPGRTGQERWLVGDGGWTIRHPATCNTLHVFGDTATLDDGGARRMPHGTAVIQSASGLRWISGPSSLIPDSGGGATDWPGPLVWDAGKLYTFTSHVRPFDGGWDDLGKDLAELAWDGQNSIRFRARWATPSTGRAGQIQQPDGSWEYTITWGAAVLAHGGYVYVYGTYREHGWFGHRVHVARVPAGKLTTRTSWRYWDGRAWARGEQAAAPVLSEFGGTEASFSVGMDAGRVKIVSKKDGTFGSDVVRWTAAAPTGPFMNPVKVASYPWTENDQTYLAIAHYDMPRFSDGTVPLTVSHGRLARYGFGDMWDNPHRHRNSWEGVAP